MIIVEKNSPINLNVTALSNGKKLLRTDDNKQVQKWANNGLKNAGYLEETSEGHIFGYDKYLFIVDNNVGKRFTIKDVRLQHEDVKVEEEGIRVISEPVALVTKENQSVESNEDTVRKLRLTQHAVKEALNDFPELGTTKRAESWLRKTFKSAKLVDESTTGSDGKVRNMYCFENTVLIVERSEEMDSIITVYKIKHQAPSVENMIKTFLETELKKMKRKDTQIQKKNGLSIAKLNMEISECQIKALTTRSQSVMKDCHNRIAEIDREITMLEKEMFEVKREKTLIAQGIVYYA